MHHVLISWHRHKAIIAYLAVSNHPQSAQALRDELGIGETFDDATRKKYEGLLEKKWTSVVRLQKKIMDLESRNASLQSELDSATPTSLMRKNTDPASWLPRSPARHTLQSHRQPITCVAFHPVFTSLASGSEDTTIKIWDWELGELERTVKGHTKGVLDVDFGGPRGGTLLASCSSDLTIKLWDPSDDSSAEFLATGSRDKTIKLWDGRGTLIKTLTGHDNWVRALVFHPGGKYLLSCGDDKTIRCWDLAQEGKCVKTIEDAHGHFVSCMRWAPSVQKEPQTNGDTNGTPAPPNGAKKEDPNAKNIRCVIATGSVDLNVRVFAS
ncbi:Nuclear distribution protein pac1 [Neofusicoccum parvum]|nr:Nuclear distribution protein pac1 [Neofusicoccum parvum]